MLWLRGQPLIPALFCFAVAYVLLVATRRKWSFDFFFESRWLSWVSVSVAVVFVAIAIGGPAVGAFSGHIVYPDEPTILSIAAAELHGQPVYHAEDASERYSLLYGPVTYWVYMLPMFAGVTSIRLLQLWVILPLGLTFLCMWKLCRSLLERRAALVAVFFFAVIVIMQSVGEWAMKGDSWLLLGCGLALLGDGGALVEGDLPAVIAVDPDGASLGLMDDLAG